MCHSPVYASMTDAERAEVDFKLELLEELINARRARIQKDIDQEIADLHRLKASAESEAATCGERIADLNRFVESLMPLSHNEVQS